MLISFNRRSTMFLQVFKILFDDVQIQLAKGGQDFKTRLFCKIGFQLVHFLFTVRHTAAISFQDGDIVPDFFRKPQKLLHERVLRNEKEAVPWRDSLCC